MSEVKNPYAGFHLEELLKMQIEINAEIGARTRGVLFTASFCEANAKDNKQFADALKVCLDLLRKGL